MHSYFSNQDCLIFNKSSAILLFTMKKDPYSPHTMIAHCRFCDNRANFQLKPNDNDLLSVADLELYSASCQDEYLDLKSVRLHYKLKKLSSEDEYIAEFFHNNPRLLLTTIKNAKNSSPRAVYYFNNTFPIKKLKRLFSTLNIVLIAKNEGGQDE